MHEPALRSELRLNWNSRRERLSKSLADLEHVIEFESNAIQKRLKYNSARIRFVHDTSN